MADTGNPEDLVSQVSVTGTEESAAKLNAYADSGAKSFEKLNVAAQTSAKGVEVAAAKIDAAGATTAGGFKQIEESGNRLDAIPGHIKNIERAVQSFAAKLPALTQAVGRFSQRVALVGAAAVAAGVGLASAAAKVAKGADTQTNATDEMTKAQVASNNASLQGQVAAINLESEQRKLLQQVNDGKITYAQYNEGLKELNKQYTEQQRVAREVENATERVRLENERLEKQAADRKAFQAQVDLFGGPLLQSLIGLGRQASTLFQEMKNTFGPVIAKGIDLVSNALSKNGTAISAFFDLASGKLNTLLTTSGPQLQTMFENIGKAASAVFIGILDALPGIIDFVNNVLVPAVSKAASIFNGIATAINTVFGTKLTGGGIVLIAILAQITGSIRLLFALVRAGGGIFKGFITIIEQVGIAIAEVFGFKTAAKLVALGGAAAKSGGPFKTLLAVIRTAIPLIVTLGTTVAAALGIGFGPAIVVIAAVTAALVFLVTKIDWASWAASAQAAVAGIVTGFQSLVTTASAVVQGVIAGFQTMNAFFNSLPATVGAFFVALWGTIVAGATAAVQLIIGAWTSIVSFFSTLGTSVAEIFVILWNSIVTAAKAVVAAIVAVFTPIGDGIVAAFKVAVTFIQTLPATLQAVWDAIKTAITTAFQTAVDTVTTLFTNLLAKAREFLTPIIDLLQAIASLSSSVSAGDSPQTVRAAGGGHIRGPGTSTSDSIPAWLSNNEFVMRARAVGKYGVGMMRAINNGTFRMPKFNMGGLVSGMNPSPRFAYADGGEVRSPATMRPVNLSLFGQEFNGLLAPEDVGERLTKFAVARQTRSAGRKPAWLGRGRN